MKHAYLFPGLALLVSLGAACASADEDDFGDGGAGGAASGQTTATSATQAVTSNVATTAVATTAAGGMCPSSCDSDAVCQNSCPALGANLSNCCDLQTTTCYVNNAPSCPPPQNTTTGASMY